MSIKFRLKNIIKSNHLIFAIYKTVGSLLISFVGLFVKVNPNQVLFVSYGGQKYDDSPRVVYEYIKNNPNYHHLKCVWAFVEPDRHETGSLKVKIDTMQFYLTALKSGYWITNSSVSRGFNFKKKKTKNYLFQHGMVAIKKVGCDIPAKNKTFHASEQEKFNLIFLEGKSEAEILSRAWNYPINQFAVTGLPRNDSLANLTDSIIMDIREKLHIPKGKKVILYAPTYREYLKDATMSSVLELPFTFEKWKRALSDKYVLLLTAHYEVANY